ncbi:hypothetical protein BDK51DRAFT_34054, partial [Blyttiomyces helicus]
MYDTFQVVTRSEVPCGATESPRRSPLPTHHWTLLSLRDSSGRESIFLSSAVPLPLPPPPWSLLPILPSLEVVQNFFGLLPAGPAGAIAKLGEILLGRLNTDLAAFRRVSGIPEFFETDVSESLAARTESLATFRELGPPDLCHIVKTNPKAQVKDIGSYHFVLGTDASSSATLAAYLNSLSYTI